MFYHHGLLELAHSWVFSVGSRPTWRPWGWRNPGLVGFKHFLCSIIYGIIVSIDSYFSEGLKPLTSGVGPICTKDCLLNVTDLEVEILGEKDGHRALTPGPKSKLVYCSFSFVSSRDRDIIIDIMKYHEIS
jgi:hypothetical protein